MKHALLIFICFCTKPVQAEVGLINLDTTIDKSNYKISRKKFLEDYGKNDSAKAFINFYFNKRGNRLADAVPPVVGGSLLTFVLTRNQAVNHTKDDYSFVIIGPLVIFTTAFVATFVVQEVKRAILTKKKLYQILDNYNHGMQLPIRFTRNRKFKIELDKLKGIYPQFRLF